MSNKNKAICIYTSIVDNYDNLPKIINHPLIDYIAFANNSHNYIHDWDLKIINYDIKNPILFQ